MHHRIRYAAIFILAARASIWALDDLPLFYDEGNCSHAGVSFGYSGATPGTLDTVTETWVLGNPSRSWPTIPITCADHHSGTDAAEVLVPVDMPTSSYYDVYLKWTDDTKKNLAGYSQVRFWVKNLSKIAKTVHLALQSDANYAPDDLTGFVISGDTGWQEVAVPLSSFSGYSTSKAYYGFGLRFTYPDPNAGSALHLLLDDIRITDGDHPISLPTTGAGAVPAHWPKHFLVSRMDNRSNDTTAAKYQVGEYRYQYIMPESLTPSWGDTLYAQHYAQKSAAMGVKSAFVWYNLGKVSEPQVALNLASTSYMTDYVSRYETFLHQLAVAGQSDYIIVLEPDMYGLLLQGNHAPNLNCADVPVAMAAANAAAGETYPENLCGWAQYVISRAHTKLPNGVIMGHMMNHWGINIPFQVGQGRVEAHIMSGQSEGTFINSFGNWKGDVVFVEKADRDAGEKNSTNPGQNWFWDSTNYAKYFTWARNLSAKTNLRIVGWQIAEGNMANTNALHRDEVAQYFLDHPDQWKNAGFIGILFGPGDQTTCTNYGGDDDGGWFLSKFTTYNQNPEPIDSALGDITSIAPRTMLSGNRLLVLRTHDGFKLSGWTGSATVRLLNAVGQEIAVAALSPSQTFHTPSLHGIYLMDVIKDGAHLGATIAVP
jgi:hypothetical protein